MWLDPSKPQEIFQVSQHCPFLLNHVLNSNKASLQEYTNTHTRYLQPVKTEANHVLHFYCTLHDSIFTEDSKGQAEEGGWWRSEVWQAWNAQTARQTMQSSGACCPVWFLTLALQRGGHRWLWRPCYNENRVQHQALHAVVLGQHSRVHQGERDDCAQGRRHTHTRTWDRPTVRSKQMYINPMSLLYLGWTSDLTLHNIWPITLPEVGKRVKHENRTSWNWMFEYHLTIWLENGCSCSSIIVTIKTFHILNQ